MLILTSILTSAVPIKFKRYKKEVIIESVDKKAKKEDFVKSVIILKKLLQASGFDFKLKSKDNNTISINFRTE